MADTEVMGFLRTVANNFEVGGQSLLEKEAELREKLAGEDGSNPTVLAEYQAAMSELTIFRNAQTSTVKTFKDVDATIVANFR